MDYPKDRPALEPGKVYSWRLYALYRGRPVGAHSEACFSTPEPELRAVELISPINIVAELPVSFVWRPLEGAEVYTLEVLDGEGRRVLSERVSTTSFVAEELEPGRMYRWTVRPDVGLPSEMATFYTAAPPEVREVTGIAFAWDPIPGAVRYRFTLSPNPDLSEPIWTTTSHRAALFYPKAAPPLKEGRTYYWRAQGLGKDGTEVGEVRGELKVEGEYRMSLEEFVKALRAFLPDRGLERISVRKITVDGRPADPGEVLRLLRTCRIVRVTVE